MEPSPDRPRLPFSFEWNDLPGPTRALFTFATGLVVCIILLVPLGWWSSAADALRSLLEALPLGSAVATTPAQDGAPALIAIGSLLVVAAAIWGATRWRVRSVHGYVYGGSTFVQPFTVSMIRTVTIFGGLTLVPILAVIASGKDLREAPEHTFTGPAWPVLIVLSWLAYSWVGLAKVHNRELGGR